MLKTHIPFFYDCFNPSDDKIYQLPPQNLNSTQAPRPISISSNSSSILPTSGFIMMSVNDLTTVWSVVLESSVTILDGIPLMITQSSPCVEYSDSDTIDTSEVLSILP